MYTKILFFVVCLILCKMCESNNIKDSRKNARGILGGSLPKWRDHVRKVYPEQKAEQRFWPPVQKESRCKY